MPPGEARDVAAREAFLTYAADLAFGRIDPRDLEPDWTAPVRDRDLEADLARALENADVFAVLEGLSPAHPDYLALRRELIRLNAVRREYTSVPTGPILEEGDAGERVDALRTRLAEEGLLTGAIAPGAVFDTRLRTALVRYQARHNLAADGRAGPDTIRELNKNSQQRLDQVRANLERWRWVPRDLGERHIRVNLADYRLEAWEDGEIAPRAPLHDRAGLQPHAGLLRGDDLHRDQPGLVHAVKPGRAVAAPVQDQSGLCARIRFPAGGHGHGRCREPVGCRLGEPALPGYPAARTGQLDGGEVKFMFPNIHNIYIHDTPERALFDQVQRNASSGCVRVEDPRDLAWWVISREEGWTRETMEEAFDNGRTRRIWLRHTIPVHILYFTAVSNRFGHVRYLHDVYRRDAALIAALDGPVGEPS